MKSVRTPQDPPLNVLVTGGCGFIGSHLCRFLIRNGVEKLLVVDDLSTGSLDALGEEKNQIEIICSSLEDISPNQWKEILADVDIVYHLAAVKHRASQNDETFERLYQVNIHGTHDLFHACGVMGVRRVVFTSSLYVYGLSEELPFREVGTTQPRTLYGTSKVLGEQLLERFGNKYGFEWNVLRLFFVYGPGQLPGMGYESVIIKNSKRLQRNDPPIIFGDGTQILDYVYIDDVIQALYKSGSTEMSDQVVNICSGERTSVLNINQHLVNIEKSSESFLFEPPDWTQGTERYGDFSKAKKLFDWIPETSLEEGLKRTYQWIKVHG